MFIAFLLAVMFNCFVGRLAWVIGDSMEPNYHNRNLLFISVSTQNIKRNDVIVFKSKRGRLNEHLIKRVIGLPGETVEIKNGKVYINGDVFEGDLINDYIEDQGDFSEITLSNDEYYVLGDNRNNSRDSRWLGGIHLKQVSGIVRFDIFPPFIFEKSGA